MHLHARNFALLAATLSFTTFSACSNKAPTAEAAATPVAAETARDGLGAPTIRTNGVVANKDEMRLSFKVGGVIRQIYVQEGEKVHRGQKLAEIEQTEINAQVEQAQAVADKAQRDLARGERLFGDKVISLEQLQDLRTQASVSKATLDSAKFNWGYAAIVAPHDGTVMRKLAEDRELVAAGAPVIVLGSQDRGFVLRAGLADRDIVQVHLGDAAQVTLDAHPGETLSGKVTEVASAADQASGLFTIEVAIERSPLSLKSGLVAKVVLVPTTAHASSRVYVPVGSIVEGDGDRASVFVLDHDRVRRRAVEIAFIEGENVALTSGVQRGERIVTDGALYLADGERVAEREAGREAGARLEPST
jgi:RND family efflux transporter MFP subunit